MSESSKVSVNYFCVGAFLIFMGSILFCTFGFTVVLPFQVTRQWPRVDCRVLNSSFDQRFCSCEEGYSGWDEEISPRFKHHQKSLKTAISTSPNPLTKTTTLFHSESLFFVAPFSLAESPKPFYSSSNCFNKYPCLKIYIKYREPTETSIPSKDLSSTPTTLASYIENAQEWIAKGNLKDKNVSNANSMGDETDVRNEVGMRDKYVPTTLKVEESSLQVAQLFRSWDDSFYEQCTLIECGEDVWNTKMNSRFQKSWGKVGQSYPCYYDPNHKSVAILEKTSSSMAFHAIFWPVMCFMAGAMLWACLCAGCCKDKESMCKEKNKLKG